MDKIYPTFIYGEYVGLRTRRDITELLNSYWEGAFALRHKADHIIYAYYDCDESDNRVYHFDILPKTEKEFDDISKLSNYFIYAIHRR